MNRLKKNKKKTNKAVGSLANFGGKIKRLYFLPLSTIFFKNQSKGPKPCNFLLIQPFLFSSSTVSLLNHRGKHFVKFRLFFIFIKAHGRDEHNCTVFILLCKLTRSAILSSQNFCSTKWRAVFVHDVQQKPCDFEAYLCGSLYSTF